MFDLQTRTREADWIEASIQFFAEAVSPNSTVALSGGGTPKPVYQKLAKDKALIEQLNIFVVDERYVSRDDAANNHTMITGAVGREVYSFTTDKSIDASLKEYEKHLADAMPFDLVILGMGPDGHIASLFPQCDALKETARLVAHTQTEIFEGHDRLTLTFPAILSAKKLVLLLAGKKKQAALNELLNGSKSVEDFPAKKLLEHPTFTIIFGDY